MSYQMRENQLITFPGQLLLDLQVVKIS